jgi:hypothetical protein
MTRTPPCWSARDACSTCVRSSPGPDSLAESRAESSSSSHG